MESGSRAVVVTELVLFGSKFYARAEPWREGVQYLKQVTDMPIAVGPASRAAWRSRRFCIRCDSSLNSPTRSVCSPYICT